MDAELLEIFELSCEKGFRTIIDEAEWQLQADLNALVEFVETLSALPNHYHRVMATYLDYPEHWKGATEFYGHSGSLEQPLFELPTSARVGSRIFNGNVTLQPRRIKR